MTARAGRKHGRLSVRPLLLWRQSGSPGFQALSPLAPVIRMLLTPAPLRRSLVCSVVWIRFQPGPLQNTPTLGTAGFPTTRPLPPRMFLGGKPSPTLLAPLLHRASPTFVRNRGSGIAACPNEEPSQGVGERETRPKGNAIFFREHGWQSPSAAFSVSKGKRWVSLSSHKNAQVGQGTIAGWISL